jgi:hypothetical protein
MPVVSSPISLLRKLYQYTTMGMVSDPTFPDNPAHAEIHTIPDCPDKKVFRKLCERLAQLANERSWEIEPSSLPM